MTTTNPTDRPREFDERLLAYLPGLRAAARRIVHSADQREDIINDTIVYVLDHWQNFREDKANPSRGFYRWLTWQMRAIIQNKSRKRKLPTGSSLDVAARRVGVNAEQHDALEARQIIEMIEPSRGGVALLRRGMGMRFREIGDELGVSTTRAQQLSEQALGELRAALA